MSANAVFVAGKGDVCVFCICVLSKPHKDDGVQHIHTVCANPYPTLQHTWQAVDADQGCQQCNDSSSFKGSSPQVVNLLDTLEDLVDIIGHKRHSLCIGLLGNGCHGVALSGDGSDKGGAHADTHVEHAKAHALEGQTQQPCVDEEKDGQHPAHPDLVIYRSVQGFYQCLLWRKIV